MAVGEGTSDETTISHNHPLYLRPSDSLAAARQGSGYRSRRVHSVLPAASGTPATPRSQDPYYAPSVSSVPHIRGASSGTDNYNLWCRSMSIALFTKNKVGYIDGTCEKKKLRKELLDQWDRCNAFVLSWIMNTVTNELCSSVIYASSAYNVWNDLKERFDKRNISRIYNLHQEIYGLKQGLAPVSTYFSKLKDLWDEYDAMTPTPSCPCPKSKVFIEHIQHQRLVQFLSGLNESFA
nr:uncharacterized protein LOC104114307 [Nicotiana tomentosiformis]